MKHLYLILLIFLMPKMQFAQGDNKVNEQKEQKMYYFVFFGEGQSNLSSSEWSKLENFIWDVKLSNPKISRIDIHGYAGTSKTEKKYPALSAERADIVKNTINGFGIPTNIIYTTKGLAVGKDAPEDPALKRRATICVYYTGTIKRDQGKTADPAFDPNFDKKIETTPATLAKPETKDKAAAPADAGVKVKVPASPKPSKPAVKSTGAAKSNWE